ncbi:hypothetical protein Stsp01_02980 [Streptomyces sp. NBRC 13847]|nr:hypothetical protein Stsp01_02980 [Streptomyces sp. NBRC 13847]
MDEGGGAGAGDGLAVHDGGSFQERRNGRRKRLKAAPRAAFAECVVCARKSVGRRMSGPPPVHVHGRVRVHARHPTGRPADPAGREQSRLTLRAAYGRPGGTP